MVHNTMITNYSVNVNILDSSQQTEHDMLSCIILWCFIWVYARLSIHLHGISIEWCNIQILGTKLKVGERFYAVNIHANRFIKFLSFLVYIFSVFS